MSLVSELKRRNVIRVAIAYAIAAWLLIEVSATTFPMLRLPEWTATFVAVLLMIGFPVALIFAWAYELTPEGVKRDTGVGAASPPQPRAAKSGTALSSDLKSIAVLPFENMSREEANEPFTIGLHDDLLTHISKIRSIKTISRTSVSQYRGTTKTIPQIAEELGVRTVLEGGVQRAGDRVRINAQLIDARTDQHLWAESYDRQLTVADIFAIQSEIATAIAEALRATLSPEEHERLETAPTENLAAYDAYLLGRQRMTKRTSIALAEAVDYFQQAIEIDPDFALAYVGLAENYELQGDYSGIAQDEMFAKAEIAIGKALELDDRLGEAHASLGRIKTFTGDFEGAEPAFQRALQLNSNYATAHDWYAILLGRSGRFPEALAQIKRGLELDPLSGIINHDMGYILSALGRFDESLAQFEKVIEIDPAFPTAYWHIGQLYSAAFGRLDKAVVWHRKGIYLDPGNPEIPASLSMVYLDVGDDVKAKYWVDRSMMLGPENGWSVGATEMFHLYRGEAVQVPEYASKLLTISPSSWARLADLRNHGLQAGEYTEAQAHYEKACLIWLTENESIIDRTNYRPAIDLALILQKKGIQERAGQILDRCLTVIQSMPRLGIEGYGISDALIYAQQGKTKEALAALRQALDERWRTYSWYYFEHDANLDSIRQEPEFQAMWDEVKTDMAEQLVRLHEWEANGELAPIPKSLE
jgi:TolB-like protein